MASNRKQVTSNKEQVTSCPNSNLLPVTCYLLLVTLISAEAGEKSTGADFLRIEPSAAAAAMGGGFGALTDDVHALYYNPAGLARVGRTQMTATHTEWLAGLQNEFVAVAFPIGPVGWGFSGAYLHAEETERDNVGRPLSTFVIGDAAVSVGLGIRLTARHYLGFDAKWLNRTLYHRSANGFAADVGYQYRLQTEDGDLWSAGVVVKNIGPDIGFSVKEKLPTAFEASVAYQPSIALRRPLTLTVGLRNAAYLDGVSGMLGVQGTVLGRFHLRAGYATSAGGSEKLRAGFGVDLFDLGRVDFAAVRIGQFNSSLFLSLTLQLGRK